MRILVVEDEGPIAEGLRFNFQQEGYDVLVAGDGPTALASLQGTSQPVDLVVLDLMLPGMSGYEICTEIRKTREDLPILVLSARPHSEDRAHAFDCGANQYVTKPFHLQEMLSRVRGLLKQFRRELITEPTPPAAPDPFEFNNVRVEFSRFQVLAGEQTHALTTMEMQLLRYFIEHEGVVLPREQILRDVWGHTVGVTTRSIDNFVMRLRKMVETDPSQPRHLLSVRGTGYRFVAEASPAAESEEK
ncbi:MAG: response regulator transcription factor [Pirellulales bacterium]|nr:response regulator transcription factor [Pirellulales bacterium]